METLEQIVAEAAPVREIWARRAFCPLGEGDIDIPGVLDALADIGYGGWLVVEQDVLPDPDNPHRPAEEQRATASTCAPAGGERRAEYRDCRGGAPRRMGARPSRGAGAARRYVEVVAVVEPVDATVGDLEFRAHSGGIAVDMGVHEFDQARWLTGQERGGGYRSRR